jgi:transcriptional regulator with XRE-family HTH domain
MVRTKQEGFPGLGQQITRLMEERGYTPSDLSARSQISLSYLTRILRGEVGNPTIVYLKRIADALGMTVTDLLPDDFGSPITSTQLVAESQDQLQAISQRLETLHQMVEQLLEERRKSDDVG